MDAKRTCACGAEFVPPPSRTRPFSRCESCRSRRGRYVKVDRTLHAPCPVCGGPVIGQRSKQFCSESCKGKSKSWTAEKNEAQRINRVLRGWYEFGPPKPRPVKCPLAALSLSDCVICGLPFISARRKKFCSDRCRNTGQSNRLMGLYRTAYETGLVKQAMHWRYELVRYLRERDGDKCRLCKRKMDFVKSTGARGKCGHGATVDHIVPLSCGGSDDLSNLQLACWDCNRLKGNRGSPQQLQLVG